MAARAKAGSSAQTRGRRRLGTLASSVVVGLGRRRSLWPIAGRSSMDCRRRRRDCVVRHARQLYQQTIRRSRTPPVLPASATSVGAFGAWVADIALLLFGLSAYLLVFGSGNHGAARFSQAAPGGQAAIRSTTICPAYAHGIGFVLLLFGAVSLESTSFSLARHCATRCGRRASSASGVAQFLQAGVGFTGATVIMLVVDRDRTVAVPRFFVACGSRAVRRISRRVLTSRATQTRGGRRSRDRRSRRQGARSGVER